MLTLQKYLRNVQRNLGQSCALRKTDHSMSQMANLQRKMAAEGGQLPPSTARQGEDDRNP